MPSQAESSTAITPEDIGALLKANQNLNNLDRTRKYWLLTSKRILDSSYYPKTYCAVSKQYRHFLPSLFKKYPWLYYSPAGDGAFCRACAFFAPESAGGQSLGQFVVTPFNTWRRLPEKAQAHSTLEYHLNSLTKMGKFLNNYKNPTQAVDAMLVTQAQKQMEASKKVI